MSESKFHFDYTINVSVLMAAVILLVGFVWGYADTKRDIQLLKENQEVIQDTYVTQEYLKIVIVERIDRLDKELASRLLQLEGKLEAQLNRIENKMNE